MKKKFLSLLICAATCVSFASMQAVHAQTNDNVNNQKIETKDTRTGKNSKFKLIVKELKNSNISVADGLNYQKNYKNPPSKVKVVLSQSMEPTIDNVMTLLEQNKDIFIIEDPRNQLGIPIHFDVGLHRSKDGKKSIILAQKVGDFFIANRYYKISFDNDNKTLEIGGCFDNSYYDKHSIVSQRAKLTKKEAFDIVRNDILNNVDKYTDSVKDKKAFTEEQKNVFIDKIRNADYSEYYIEGNAILKYVCPNWLYDIRKYYNMSIGNHDITVDANNGKIYLENEELGVDEWLYGKYDNIKCK